jgi:hypothetical protein
MQSKAKSSSLWVAKLKQRQGRSDLRKRKLIDSRKVFIAALEVEQGEK